MLLLLDIRLLGNPNKPIQEDGADGVEKDIGPQEPKVAPSVTKININTSKKCVGVGKGAVVALLSTRAAVPNHVAAPGRDILFQELGTDDRSISGRFERDNFVCSTFDRSVGQCRTQESFHDVCQRVDPVHEDPKAWQLIRTGEDAAEDEHHDEE